MAGLHNSSAFHLEIGDEVNQTVEYMNYDNYVTTGIILFSKNCIN